MLCMAEVPGGCFVSGAKRGDIKVWDMETCTIKSECTGHTGAVNALVVDGNRVFSVSSDKTIKVPCSVLSRLLVFDA